MIGKSLIKPGAKDLAKKLQERFQSEPSRKNNAVTQEHIEEIISESFIETKTILGKCTVVACQLPNGFIIVESSACVDPANYDEKLGKEICLERIKNKVWELEGYRLQSSQDFYSN